MVASRRPVYSIRAAVVALAVSIVAPGTTTVAAGPQAQPINGMTVSTPRGSSAWASDDMVGTIGELKGLGVNWIAIHPYGRVSTDGTVSWSWPRRRRGDGGEAPRGRPDGADSGSPNPQDGAAAPDAAPEWLRRPIEEAHRQGLKILVKPHLENWRDYEWRGDIRYDSDAEWDRFFTTYTEWIVTLASFSGGADAFAVGTELGGTAHHEGRWRAVIGSVRDVYDGHLTYAANWDAYERVGFWDALDSVGIQAYFPVLESPPPNGNVPPQRAFDDGWRDIMARVRAFSAQVGKPVVFTEAGYNNSPTAPYQPWDWDDRGDAEELQIRCMIAALQAIAAEPSVMGAFLWKWYPGDRVPRDFAMAAPNIRRVIRDHWAVAGR